MVAIMLSNDSFAAQNNRAGRFGKNLGNLIDLLHRLIGPVVYLFTALYVGTLFVTLPDSLRRVLQVLVVVILAVKVAQVLLARHGPLFVQ